MSERGTNEKVGGKVTTITLNDDVVVYTPSFKLTYIRYVWPINAIGGAIVNMFPTKVIKEGIPV